MFVFVCRGESSSDVSLCSPLSKSRRASSSSFFVSMLSCGSAELTSTPIIDCVGADGVELGSKTGSSIFAGEARFSLSLQIAAIGCSL